MIAPAQVLMLRPSLDNFPQYSLPSPFTIRWYQAGDEQHWLAIKARSDHFHHADLTYYLNTYGAHAQLLPERQAFLCDHAAQPIGTTTAWFEDFAGQHFLLYAISPKDSTVYKKVLNPAGVTPRKVTHVPLTEAILEMVRANLGIAVFARWAVAPLLASGELNAVRLTRWGIRRTWFAAVRRNLQRPPHVDAFVSLLQKFPISQSFRARRPAQVRAATLLHKP